MIRPETIQRIEAGTAFGPHSGAGTRWGLFADAMDPDYLRAAAASIQPNVASWRQFKNGKLQFSGVHKLPPALQDIFSELQGDRFVDALRTMSGIEDLTPDRQFNGAGLHATPRGGSLGVHVDFNRHPDGRYRRLNLFLFLGDGVGWQGDWGGNLELWDATGKRAAVRIVPDFNRLALFESTETSWHGQPVPLTCPDGRYRLSLAVYYFSESTPADYRAKHSTIYKPEKE
jgi:Rps23 Pro-64 3,4-dihydroxylase Tpa1-like proline 4-hydroxylase